jgi:type II protein arginine methyltransferase
MQQKRELCDNSLTLARKYQSEGRLARSFAHFLVHWTLNKSSNSTQGCDLEEIVQVLDDLTLKLEAEQRTKDLISTYQQAMEVLPHDEDITYRYANALFKHDVDTVQARLVLAKSKSLKAKELLDTINSYALDRWHFSMINDKSRNLAFFQALQHEVQTSDVVLDIGTGCGLLSLFAAKAQAKKVIACEASEDLVNIAKQVFKANDFHSIELHHALSTHLVLDNKADVLVTETFDAGLLGEHVLEILDHAWKNLLHEKSKVVPAKAKVFIALAFNNEVMTRNRCIRDDFGPLSLSMLDITAEEMKTEPYDSQRLEPAQLVTHPQELVEINFNDKESIHRYLKSSNVLQHRLCATKSSQVNCLVMWFELILDSAGQVRLNTGPQDQKTCCWEQAVYPLPQTFELMENQEIAVEMLLKGHFSLTKVELTSDITSQNEAGMRLILKHFIHTDISGHFSIDFIEQD